MKRLASKILGVVCLIAVGAATPIAFAEEAPHAGPGETAETPSHEVAEGHGAPGVGEAHHGGAPHINFKSLVLQIVNFGVLLFILIKFGGPAVSKALAARHEQLKAELAAAAEAKAAAEARLAKQEQRLAKLESEIAGIQAGIKQEAEVEKARLIALAEDRARRIREETSFLVDQQVKEAQEQLRRDAAQAAIELAEKLIRGSLDARDQQRLIDNFVGGVASGNGAPATGGAPPSAPPNGRGATRSTI